MMMMTMPVVVEKRMLVALLLITLWPACCVAFTLPSVTTITKTSTTAATPRRIAPFFVGVTTAPTGLSPLSWATTTTKVASSSIESDETETVSEAAPAAEDESNKALETRHTVFLGNLPFDMTETEVSELCSAYGTVTLVTIPKNRESGLPRGFAFVDMSTAEELQAVVNNVDGTMFKGRSLRANVSEKGGSSGSNTGSGSNNRERERKVPQEQEGIAKLYVGNLPFEADREELLNFYKQYVDAVEAYIPMNANTGTGRGFAFVSVKTEDLETAIERTNGVEFQGRPLMVSKPLPPGQRANNYNSNSNNNNSRPQREKKPQRDTVKMYVGNLAFSTDVGILEEVFGEFGEVIDCYMPQDPERGGSRGFGFVTMERVNGMDAIAELNGCELDGRFIRVNEALQKTRSSNDNKYDDDNDD